MFKIITMKNGHKIWIHTAVCNISIVWTIFEREGFFFFFFCLIKLIYIRCLINVNKMYGLLRNGWMAAKWVIYGKSSLNASFIFL